MSSNEPIYIYLHRNCNTLQNVTNMFRNKTTAKIYLKYNLMKYDFKYNIPNGKHIITHLNKEHMMLLAIED